MKKNNLIAAVIVSILLGAVGFFGGIQYQKSKTPKFPNGLNGSNMKGQSGDRTMPSGINQIRGTILSKDDKSVTLKIQDESSKIVVLSDTTLINKTETGSLNDLNVGEEIAVFGKTNNDGSVTAENIQVRVNIVRHN